MPRHPIFDNIYKGDLEGVKSRMLANPAVLDEKDGLQLTPLAYVIAHRKPTIVHWLIEHRGQHDVNTQTLGGMTALHSTCSWGRLSMVQALVASGADPVMMDWRLMTPLMFASIDGHSNIVAYLLELPAVRPTVDTGDRYSRTALAHASSKGSTSCVQLLLDAGADPTIPAGNFSSLHMATSNNHTDIAALLRAAIAVPPRPRPPQGPHPPRRRPHRPQGSLWQRTRQRQR